MIVCVCTEDSQEIAPGKEDPVREGGEWQRGGTGSAKAIAGNEGQ